MVNLLSYRFRVVVAFALVSFFWGSTYLAIGIGVKYVPPALLSGVRFAAAGTIMLAWCAFSGSRIRVGVRDLVRLALVGILLLTVSNVMLVWAEETVPTGIAALLASMMPVWLLVIDSWVLDGERLSPVSYAGLALGIAGVALLVWPELTAARSLGVRNATGALAVLGSGFVWALGSVISRRWPASVAPSTATGWQMLLAGAVNLTMAVGLGQEHRAQWTGTAIAAVAYLAVFGSLVGYSAYIWLLAHVPVAKAGTYAYVNPVVAVFLGWLVLGERVDAYVVCGSLVIVIAVAMATRARTKVATNRGTDPIPRISIPTPELPPPSTASAAALRRSSRSESDCRLSTR